MYAGRNLMIQSLSKPISIASFAAVVPEAQTDVAASTSPWTTMPGGVVDSSEIVLLAIKPSMWRPVFDSAAFLVTSVLLSIALLWTGKTLPGLSQSTSTQVILMLGVIRLGWAIVDWVPRWHILTSRRIIDVSGVRIPCIESCNLLDIRNTYLNRSSGESLTRLGTIIFVVDHLDTMSKTWRNIAKPDLIHAKIRRAIESAIDQHGLGI